jgi:hypothetical protein
MNARHDTHLDDVLHRKSRLETRVYLPTDHQKTQYGTAEKHQYGAINSYRVVIALEKFAQGIDGLQVHSQATEEVDKILVAHS